jgi:hypothetical protein
MDKELPSQRDVNVFLDVVRSSGVTNMFGAGPYIEEHFGVTKQQARNFLSSWMNTFSERRANGEVIE